MPIINRSSQLYTPGGSQAPGASFAAALTIFADFAPEAAEAVADCSFDGVLIIAPGFAPVVYSPFAVAVVDGALDVIADFSPVAATVGDCSFDSELNIVADFECDTTLALQQPESLLRSVSANAFSKQDYRGGGGRLFVNNVQTDFIRAEINAPAGTLGKTLSIELAKAELSQLPANASFKFQIGKRVSGNLVWTTIVDGAKLVSRNYRMASGRSGLSISIKDFSSKLEKFPRNNLIVFDPLKAEVSDEEIEPLYTNNAGEIITTTARSISVLTLKKLLNIAFVEGCGFSSVFTDIPNYEIARCDFSVVNSWASAVAQFIGVYEPDFRVEGNNLLIQKTVNPHPDGYAPNQLHAVYYPNFSEAKDNATANLDGYIVSFMGGAGSYYVDRNLPAIPEPTHGEFGDVDFTEVTISRKLREWFEIGETNPVRSELKKETRETRQNGVLIGRETKENFFDRLGRSTGYTNTIESRMPDVMQNNQPALLKVKEETQKISYKTNPFAPRQTLQSKIQTAYKSLLAVDADNTALDADGNDAPVYLDYEQVFGHGNLQSGMTSEFRTLETVTESFRPMPNGQIECRVDRFDAIRGKLKPGQPADVRSGDISVLNFQKQRQRTIFRAGVSQATRTGELKTLNAGELPYFFAELLTTWLLDNPPIRGQIEVVGFDESLERGVSFNLRGRAGEDLGNFKTRGYSVVIEPTSIMTQIDALKV